MGVETVDRHWSAEELALLARTPPFQGLAEDRLRQTTEEAACFRQTYEKEEIIYSPKDFRRSLGFLLKGRARVTKGELVVSTLEEGGLFGAAALFSGSGDYETTITALSPCTVAFFPEPVVAGLLAEVPDFCLNYIRYLSGRIHFLSRRLGGLTAPGSVGKLSRYLLEEADGSGAASCPATELARRLDVSRATLYRAFEELERAGAVRRQGKTIMILDRSALEAFS